MGQIIRLPLVSAAYPAATADLERPERVLLTAIRWWIAEFQQRVDPMPRLCEAMHQAGTHDSAFAADQLMALCVRAARRPLTIHAPLRLGLSEDEAHLLHAASLVQAGECQIAENVLRTTLLSAPGADFALGPLQTLAEMFAEARLFLRRRWLSATARGPVVRAALAEGQP
jgi:hypothetical protein